MKANTKRKQAEAIAAQVVEAVTPKITKAELAKELGMVRQTLDTRIKNADFREAEIRKLKQLNIVSQ